MDTNEIKEKLKCSLEIAHIRSEIIVCAFITAAYIALFTLAWGGWVLALIIGMVVLVPFLCWEGWRIRKIYREPAGYVFCKATLSQPHSGKRQGAFYFTVVLETEEKGTFAANTSPIFQSGGWMGPLLEDYVNQKVTIAYNRDTEQVVVIG